MRGEIDLTQIVKVSLLASLIPYALFLSKPPLLSIEYRLLRVKEGLIRYTSTSWPFSLFIEGVGIANCLCVSSRCNRRYIAHQRAPLSREKTYTLDLIFDMTNFAFTVVIFKLEWVYFSHLIQVHSR